MIQLVAAALILWGLTSGLKWAAHADRKKVKAAAERAIGAGLVGLALFILIGRGNFEAAAPIGALGLWMAGWGSALPRGFSLGRFGFNGAGGPVRRIRERVVELVIDEAKGTIDGNILDGAFAGRRLSDLSESECAALRALCRDMDPASVRLVDLYVDSRFAGGRSAKDGDADARRRQRSGAQSMSEKNAYEILGLPQGASREDVARAHRILMKKVHPDHGGTASLAALLNEARDILTRRHD